MGVLQVPMRQSKCQSPPFLFPTPENIRSIPSPSFFTIFFYDPLQMYPAGEANIERATKKGMKTNPIQEDSDGTIGIYDSGLAS